MPIVELPDGREVEFPEGISRQKMGNAITGFLQKEKKQKAFENIERDKRALEQESFGVKNIARDVASFIPLAGGYVDNAEAFLKSKIKGTEYNKELFNVRQNQRNYAKLVKDQGLGTARAIGNIIGGFGGGLTLPTPKVGGRLGKIAASAVEGAIESAGFGDERAKEAGVAGGLISAGVATILGGSPTRQVNEIADLTGDIRKLASDNKGTNILIRGIDSSKRVANNIKEVADVALNKNKDDIVNILNKTYGDDLVDISGVRNQANEVYGNFIDRFGREKIPVSGITDNQRINNFLGQLNLTPTGNNVLKKSILEAAEDTGDDIMTLNSLQIAKQKLDDRINFNIQEKTTSSNYVLKKTKNKLNNFIRENFPGFEDVQKQRKQAFDIAKAYEDGLNFSPTSKKSLLRIADESGRERVFKNWTLEEQQAFNQGIKANLTNKILASSETTNIANSLSTNRRLIRETLPEKEANKFIRELLKESSIFKNLTTLSSKARNRIQDRGSLGRLLGQNLTLKNIGLPMAAGYLSPALGGAAFGGQVAAKGIQDISRARAARLALQGVKPREFADLATALQTARGTAQFIREE